MPCGPCEREAVERNNVTIKFFDYENETAFELRNLRTTFNLWGLLHECATALTFKFKGQLAVG